MFFKRKAKIVLLFVLLCVESFVLTGNEGERIISEEGEPSFYFLRKEDGSNEV